MVQIPDNINGVDIEFAPSVNREVAQELVTALEETISTGAVSGQTIEKLWVSSAKDSHTCPSRHVSGLAIDISRINGNKMSTHYDSDGSVKAIVDGLQNKFESASNRRENFGPTIQKKLGQDHPVSGHGDHIHWSVNGDHSACAGFEDVYDVDIENSKELIESR